MVEVYSTNMDVRYLASSFIPAITVQDDDTINQNPQLDIFSTSIIKAIDLIEPQNYVKFNHEHLPVTARKKLGNTSCWWMILIASNKLHPLEIKPGEVLTLPYVETMRNAINIQANNLSRIPRYVII